ncbi:hypothetical protein K432DRAFT_459852 [Lepidopterella palustris CBS 459.81]|uniref:Uncharacterized protein n=1 Tax=Lepidopterella palustris CBS 459.81 TaxID=1314670 RepID=A0A8E2JJR6_9PEZI|nr:hypothetical protein K432DRAFT_459852 [Lepidopterella palustris CBS 459.81]
MTRGNYDSDTESRLDRDNESYEIDDEVVVADDDEVEYDGNASSTDKDEGEECRDVESVEVSDKDQVWNEMTDEIMDAITFASRRSYHTKRAIILHFIVDGKNTGLKAFQPQHGGVSEGSFRQKWRRSLRNRASHQVKLVFLIAHVVGPSFYLYSFFELQTSILSIC